MSRTTAALRTVCGFIKESDLDPRFTPSPTAKRDAKAMRWPQCVVALSSFRRVTMPAVPAGMTTAVPSRAREREPDSFTLA